MHIIFFKIIKINKIKMACCGPSKPKGDQKEYLAKLRNNEEKIVLKLGEYTYKFAQQNSNWTSN